MSRPPGRAPSARPTRRIPSAPSVAERAHLICRLQSGSTRRRTRTQGWALSLVALGRAWGNLDPWYWEARGLGDPDAVDERLRELRARIDAGLAVLTGEPRWTLVPFEDQDASFTHDVQELDDPKFEALQAALEEVLAVNGSVLIGTKWMHKVVNGDGVYEFRIDNDEGQIQARTGTSDPDVDDDMEVDVLVRVFFIFDGRRVILLLSAYDKDEDDSAKRQNREIEEAKRRATRHRMRAARRGVMNPKSMMHSRAVRGG